MCGTGYYPGMSTEAPGKRLLPACALSLSLVTPSLVSAHFVLQSPASWRVQDALGYPQKTGPCGNEGGGAETGVVTTYAPGETITITLDEVIYHPGHYRVALAVNDRDELPADPPVTPEVGDPCGSVPIAETPVFPVLADGALVHTAPFSEPRTIQVTLPSDVTCTTCTLQVLEFMSSHGQPCFYYHCADIAIQEGGGEACTGDGECADGDACTLDRCDPETNRCQNVDTSSTCDDGNACTADACAAAEGCVANALTLDDVSTDFLGTLAVSPCATEQVPRAVGTLFRKAETLATRASQNRAKAERSLKRALKRLRRAESRATKASGRSVSRECGAALGTALAQARARIECLLGA
jgi:hypothetical protein